MDFRSMTSGFNTSSPMFGSRMGFGDIFRDRDIDRDNFRDREADRDSFFYFRERRDRSPDRYQERERDRSLIRNTIDRGREFGKIDRSDFGDFRYNSSFQRDRSPDRRSYDRDMRDRERGRERDSDHSVWREEPPNNTIMLRNLGRHITEEHIRQQILPPVPIIDVRLMRKKDKGTSRGFAFVEFRNTSDAVRWMEQSQGSLSFLDGSRCTLHYSMPRPDEHILRANAIKTDWNCNKCGVLNFKRREYCFKCNISREAGTSSGFGFSGLDDQKQDSFMDNDKGHSMDFNSSRPEIKTDWNCNNCGVFNFKRRERCFKCNFSRESPPTTTNFPIVQLQNMLDAMRMMQQQRALMFSDNNQSSGMDFNMSRPEIKTDWNCYKCGVLNFKRRENCFKCNVPREGSSRGFGGFQDSMSRPDQSPRFFDGTPHDKQYNMSRSDDYKSRSNIIRSDWTCRKCGVYNFKRRERCFKCNVTRDD